LAAQKAEVAALKSAVEKLQKELAALKKAGAGSKPDKK
jgi:hypothetical protein